MNQAFIIYSFLVRYLRGFKNRSVFQNVLKNGRPEDAFFPRRFDESRD